MLEDFRAAILRLFLIFLAVLDNLFTLLVRLVLIVVTVHTLALVFVNILYDMVNNVPLTSHLFRFDLGLLRISCPGPAWIPIGNYAEH